MDHLSCGSTDEFWLNKWETKNIQWHQYDVNRFLRQFFDLYCPNAVGKKRALVPLCGKTVDMKWLLDKGCEVIGVELSKIACDDFFEEQQISYDLVTIDGLIAYKAKNNSLVIYNCDFFEFAEKAHVGKFHFIWDRGSLVVMSDENRPKYAGWIKQFMADDFSYLIEAPLYNPEEYQGFPRSVEIDNLTELYGDACKCLQVEKIECVEKAKEIHSPDLTSFFWCAYVLLPK